MSSKIGLGPGAPRRGPFSSPNRFQIINNSVVSPPLFQNIIRKKPEKMRCERNGVERAYTRKIWKIALPFWNFSSAFPYSIFYRFWENQENGFAPQHRFARCSTVLLGQGRFPILRKGTPIFHFLRKIFIFVRFFGKQEIFCALWGKDIFLFGRTKSCPGKGRYYAQTSSKGALHQNQVGKMPARLLPVR